MNENIDYFRFNINYEVFVKLTPNGYRILVDKWNEHLPEKECKTIEYFKEQENHMGYIKMLFWEFMMFFGDEISFGDECPFDTEILFDKENMKIFDK